MGFRKVLKGIKRKRLAAIGLSFGLVISSLVIVSQFANKEAVTAKAADYSGGGTGFTLNSDGSIKATFTVSNNTLDMRGWMLCLFTSQPSVDSNNKLTNSNDAHPYTYSSCNSYFFASSTTKTGEITVTWPANSADQKKHWSASASTHSTDNLKTCFAKQNLWYLVIGPRHYNTSWGDSGIGAGTDGYWENCDYYVGKSSEVFPTDKDMTVSVSSYNGTYDGNNHSISINVSDPSSGYTIRYRTASSGSYNLTTNPTYKDAGNYTTYFQITKDGYVPYQGSGTVKIAKANPTYTAPTAKSGLVYNGNNQALVNAGTSSTSTILYSLDGTNYSESIPTAKNAGSYTVYYKINETTNYKGVAAKTINVSIAKANPTYTAPTAKTGLVYNGSEQELINAGSSSTSTIQYSVGGTSYSTNIPKATNAGTYTIYYKVVENSNYKGVDPVSFTVTIAKADPVYTAPTAATGLVYNKSSQALLIAGSSSTSNFSYSLDNVSFSGVIPSAVNAGNYTVYYKLTESLNYKGTEVFSVNVSIAKATPNCTAPTAKEDLIYNGSEQALINAGSSTTSTILYSLDGGIYSTKIPTATNAGSYTVYYKIEETANYLGLGPYSVNVNIAKADPVYTAPVAKSNLVYNLEDQQLVDAGSSTTSTIEYSLDNTNYSTSVPTAKNAGSYSVYYNVVENANYLGVGPEVINVSIAKATPTYSKVPEAKIGLKYTSESQALISEGSSTGGTVLYSLDGSSYSTSIPEKKFVGNYTVYYKIQGDSNYNDVAAQTLSVSISANDKTALNAAIATSNEYLSSIAPTYPSIASELNESIASAQAVSDEDNKTVEEIAASKDELTYAYDLAHAQVTDELIENIGDVRYTNKCDDDIKAAEEAYASLSDEQKVLVQDYSSLKAARNLFNRLKAVAEVIENIGEVTYDEDCYNRINDAREAYEELSEDEQALIPTLFNELKCAEDIYEVLEAISNLGDVEYTPAFYAKLRSVRYAYDALDYIEQESISNYQELLDAEEMYQNVDEFVNLVNEIPETLEYVGTHNHDIEAARAAYDALSEEEKALVPVLVVEVLSTAEEGYEELKVEHERKEIEDREAGVVIATEGGSGIPTTVSIDINNSHDTDQDFTDSVDYQTIQETIGEDEAISSICEIKFYEEIEGEVVELSLQDIDEDMSLVIKIDVPLDVDDSNFKIVLLDEDNNIIEMEYTYDPETRQATVVTDKVGSFAIITTIPTPTVATSGLPVAIVIAVVVSIFVLSIAFFSFRRKKIS